jgi:hypothetical protein
MDGFCTKSMAASKDTPRTRGSAGLPTAGPSDGKDLKVDNGYRGVIMMGYQNMNESLLDPHQLTSTKEGSVMP